jgi:hypothetical protein
MLMFGLLALFNSLLWHFMAAILFDQLDSALISSNLPPA